MSEDEELRRSFEHRTEAQLAASRRRLHKRFEAIRRRYDRGGSLFDPPEPETPRLASRSTPSLNPHPDGGFYVQPGDKGDR